MELWIRTQDKETLIKIDRLDVDGNKIKANFKLYFSGCDYVILGTYESNDRALEVLDEIQKVIEPRGIIKQDKHGIEVNMISVPIVYEMPKE